jgi:hypothetical protein
VVVKRFRARASEAGQDGLVEERAVDMIWWTELRGAGLLTPVKKLDEGVERRLMMAIMNTSASDDPAMVWDTREDSTGRLFRVNSRVEAGTSIHVTFRAL